MSAPDLLRTGIYSAPEAEALIGVPARKIRGWIDGWPGAVGAPVIQNDLGWIDRHLAFSFANLMELRFIAFFERAGVKIREIRFILDEVRKELHRPHPFATNIVFKTDGAKVVAEIARKNGVADLYDLRTKNFEMGVVVYRSLKDGVVYNPRGEAQAWFPDKKNAPNIFIHPSIAFGHPVLKGSNIPIEAIIQSVRAEGSIEAAAMVFELSERRVKEAVAFDASLRRAA